MLFLYTAIAGLILGLLTGGRLNRLLKLEWRGLPLLLAAAAVNVAGGFFAWKVAPLAPSARLFGLCFVFGATLWVLWRTPGLCRMALLLLTLGASANFLVMAANGGQMPVDLERLRATGKPHLAERIGRLQAYRHAPLTPETRLGFLGDRVPLPRPFSVPSPGDLLLSAGIFALVWHAVRTPRKRKRRPSHPRLREEATVRGRP